MKDVYHTGGLEHTFENMEEECLKDMNPTIICSEGLVIMIESCEHLHARNLLTAD